MVNFYTIAIEIYHGDCYYFSSSSSLEIVGAQKGELWEPWIYGQNWSENQMISDPTQLNSPCCSNDFYTDSAMLLSPSDISESITF